MSMGNDYNSNYSRNGGNKNNGYEGPKEPTTYPKIRFANSTSKVDATQLKFQFMYGLLNIQVIPKMADNSGMNGERVKYDYDNSIDVWISYNHAYILSTEIKRLMKVNDPNQLKYVGVPTKKDEIINFGFGVDYGTENFILSASKLNPDGSVQKSYIYEFNDAGYNSIVNFDMNTKKFTKNPIHNVEVQMFLNILDEYVTSSTGAAAYMNRYYARYENTRRYEMLSGICDKLGVSVNNKPNYSRNNGGGFFNNNIDYKQEESLNGAMNPPTNDRFRDTSLDDMAGYDDME